MTKVPTMRTNPISEMLMLLVYPQGGWASVRVIPAPGHDGPGAGSDMAAPYVYLRRGSRAIESDSRPPPCFEGCGAPSLRHTSASGS